MAGCSRPGTLRKTSQVVINLWFAEREVRFELTTDFDSSAPLEKTMGFSKSRSAITKLTATLDGAPSEAHSTTGEIQRLGEAVTEFGQMMYRVHSYYPVYVEVRELAFRLRETSENIVSALVVLEDSGWASRTTSFGLWRLRVEPLEGSVEIDMKSLSLTGIPRRAMADNRSGRRLIDRSDRKQ
jgi:hypothetical protein